MTIKLLPAALCAGLALASCTASPDAQRTAASSVLGGAAGLVTAKALGFGDGWVAVSTLAGAAAGTLIARNAEENRCAYANGRGGTYRAPC